MGNPSYTENILHTDIRTYIHKFLRAIEQRWKLFSAFSTFDQQEQDDSTPLSSHLSKEEEEKEKKRKEEEEKEKKRKEEEKKKNGGTGGTPNIPNKQEP